jgi:hypothetical protein
VWEHDGDLMPRCSRSVEWFEGDEEGVTNGKAVLGVVV